MKDEKRNKSTAKTIAMLIPTLLFSAFVIFMLVMTFTGDVKETVTNTNLSVDSMEELSDNFEDVLQDNIYLKDEYINLNGLTTRVLGINSLNERQKLANGHLATIHYSSDMSDAIETAVKLNDFLAERGIDFLYVLAPSKTSFYDVEFAPGYESDVYQDLEIVINSLNDAGVNNIDMNAWFEENEWTMDDVYFKTDHHWKPSAAMEAAKETMRVLCEEGIAEYDSKLFEADSWDVTTLENWYLGSHGRRTGMYYAGVDDFDVYIPKFDTDYSYASLSMGSTFWLYSDSPLNLSYMDEKDYFHSSTYSLYLYGDQPRQIITNSDALNDKRLLIIGNSFRLPWQYFLTTQFKEVYSFDPRYYEDGTFAQYIAQVNPDLVIMCIHTSSLTDDAFNNLGIDEYLSALDETPQNCSSADIGDIIIEPNTDKNHFTMLSSNLTGGRTYTLTLDSTTYSGDKDKYLQMSLIDLTSNDTILSCYFDANSNEPQKWIFTVPDNTDNYAIYFYAGTKGSTAGVEAGATNIKLYHGIIDEF